MRYLIKSVKKINKVLIFLTLLFGFIFSGCSNKTASSSLVYQFDIVDALISQSQNKDALKELKKISKKVYDSWTYIGIYKRYSLLGEKEMAEKILVKGLKKIPGNQELSAVYSKFLLSENRFSEAEKNSDCLRKSRYASIYAESVFKNHRAEFDGKKSSLLYEDEKYYDLFADSYLTSRNPVWLRNCASVFLVKGRYDKALELTPKAFNDSEDAYFWAQVCFDAGDYLQAVNALESSFYFLESMGKTSLGLTSVIKLAALESDSYNALLDSESAHRVREKILCNYMTGEDLFPSLSDEEKNILPLVAVNSAYEEMEKGNDSRVVAILSYSVMNFPEYVPALVAYANFAWESNLERREDDEILALRRAGLKTLEMERYDNRAKIPLSDALYRIDQALLKINDPYLYITRLDLKFKSNPFLSDKDKTSELWKLLEESSTDTIKYHDILVLYTVNFLLEHEYSSDAKMIFRKYISSKYGLDAKNDFYDSVADICRTVDVFDLEMAAYFALEENKTEDALRMYEYCVFESSGNRGNEISPKVSPEAAMNLANLYYGLSLKDKALDLYGKVAASVMKPQLRSEAFYRIASIYFAFNEMQNALRSADYACSIYPENAKAHLLKTKITNK